MPSGSPGSCPRRSRKPKCQRRTLIPATPKLSGRRPCISWSWRPSSLRLFHRLRWARREREGRESSWPRRRRGGWPGARRARAWWCGTSVGAYASRDDTFVGLGDERARAHRSGTFWTLLSGGVITSRRNRLIWAPNLRRQRKSHPEISLLE